MNLTVIVFAYIRARQAVSCCFNDFAMGIRCCKVAMNKIKPKSHIYDAIVFGTTIITYNTSLIAQLLS